MTAIGYCRVSTAKQAESGLGLESQRTLIAETAKRLGVEVSATFSDEGVSGSLALADRPALLDAVSNLRKGDLLLVSARSRLGRDVVNVALIEREIERRGARVVSCSGEASELDGPTGQLVKTILDAVNCWERGQAALRTRLSLKALRAQGYRAGNVPFGYRADADGKLDPDPYEQGVIATARELHSQGQSVRAVVSTLRDRGVTGRTGKPLGVAQVHALLLQRKAA
jgi:DNA invertase Pin-like site-specific DNA recombinase